MSGWGRDKGGTVSKWRARWHLLVAWHDTSSSDVTLFALFGSRRMIDKVNIGKIGIIELNISSQRHS